MNGMTGQGTLTGVSRKRTPPRCAVSAVNLNRHSALACTQASAQNVSGHHVAGQETVDGKSR